MVRNLFGNSSKEAVTYVVDKYWKDFILCGYNETLEELKKIQEQIYSWDNPL
jgi:hypothetical protein